MPLLPVLIHALIWIVVILLIAYLIIWILGQLVPAVPSIIPTLIWIIAVLLVLWVLMAALIPAIPARMP